MYKPIIGVDIYKYVKGLCDQFLGDSPEMTDGEKESYRYGKSQVLSLLKQALDEFLNADENLIFHVKDVTVPTGYMFETTFKKRH